MLAHGSWWGGWSWKRVAERLRDAGSEVYAPSFTGMGERAHLLSQAITIDTFVEDLVGVIECEELVDVVLVGHSFGGVAISAVADRIPERIAQPVYLDAVVLDRGMHVLLDAAVFERFYAGRGIAVRLPTAPTGARTSAADGGPVE